MHFVVAGLGMMFCVHGCNDEIIQNCANVQNNKTIALGQYKYNKHPQCRCYGIEKCADGCKGFKNG